MPLERPQELFAEFQSDVGTLVICSDAGRSFLYIDAISNDFTALEQ